MTDAHLFILLKTQIGRKKEKGILRAGHCQVEVLAGTLLILVEERQYGSGTLKLVFEIDEHDGTILECSVSDVHKLLKSQFDLLQTVPSCKDRLDIFLNKERLQDGECFKENDRVLVHVKGHPNSLGVIRYKGPLPAMRGTYFGVELLDGKGNGTSDGVFRKKRFFTCVDNDAVFVGINKLHKEKTSRSSMEHAEASPYCALDQPRALHNTRLKIGERIVWLSDMGPEGGVVKWIGILPSLHNRNDITVGVEFDNPVGSGTGKYKDYRLFSARQNHASLVPILGLITEKEFTNQNASASNVDDENVEELVAMANSGKSEGVIEEQQAMFEQIRQQPLYARLNNQSPPKIASHSVQSEPPRRQAKKNFLVPSVVHSVEHIAPGNVTDSVELHKSAPTRYIDENRRELEVQGYIDKRKMGMNPLYELNRKAEDSDEYVAVGILPEHILGKIPDDAELSILSNFIGNNFPRLAHMLGISESTMKQIQLKSNIITEQIYLILFHWRSQSKNPTYSELQKAFSYAEINPGILCNIWSREKKFNQSVSGYKNVEKNLEQPSSREIFFSRSKGSLKAMSTSVDPDLDIGSMVEVMHNPPWYGVIRWIGHLADQKDPSKPIAGLEMEEEISAGTDGTFAQQRFFECAPRKAFFVPLYKCRKDKRFLDQASKHLNYVGSENNFGSIETPDVSGTVSPPDSIDELSKICGKNRGIQGHHNSCYLDATLFGMFFNTTVFDSILYRPRRKNDLAQYEEVKKVLKEGIVNPLRTYYYVRADKVMKLRRLLDKLGNVAGMMTEEKDPEEFLDSFLQQITKADPLLQISSNDGQTQQAYFYQLIMDKDEKLVLPSTQQLFELSFLQMDIKLKEIPSCLIIQMPRFGKDYKMYRRIIPTLELDITDVLENAPRECIICGELAAYECCQCYQVHGAGLNTIAFCEPCRMTSHQHKSRLNHSPRAIKVPSIFKEYYFNQKKRQADSVVIQREKMELFAVVCIQTSHYVSFVKCGRGVQAPWVFFDSMADRMGEQSGYNIPEITLCEDLPTWLSEGQQTEIMKESEDKNLPEHMRRLLCDAYMCMYQSPEVQMYK